MSSSDSEEDAEDVMRPPEGVNIAARMLVDPELLSSMEDVGDFADDPLMADLCKRVWFWQKHASVPRNVSIRCS